MIETVRLTREKMFELIWSGPKSQVAKDLGISDVAFTRICKKLSVPMPPRGYWVLKSRPERPTLLPTKGATFHNLKIPEVRSAPDNDQIDPEAAQLIAFEKDPRNRISVAKQLPSPHPLVATTKAALLESRPDNYGRIRPRDKACPSVCICPPSVNRAMLILEALLNALKTRSFEVSVKDGRIRVTVLGETHSFSIEERCKQVRTILTREQKALQNQEPWMFRERTFQPTGLLALKVFQGNYLLTTVSDGKRQKIEDCLNLFIIHLVNASLIVKADRRKRQQREDEWRRKDEENALHERLRTEESTRIERLKVDAANWEQSRILRAYIEAVKKKFLDRGLAFLPESDEGQWVAWASAQAERLDPLRRWNFFQKKILK